MFCSKCGKELADGTHYCPQCGNPVRPPQPTAQPGQAVSEGLNVTAAPGTPPPTGSASASTASKAIVVCCALVAIAAIVAVALVLLPRLVKPNPQESIPGEITQAATASVTTADGKEVQALPRPNLLASLEMVGLQAGTPDFTPAVPDLEVASDLSNVTNLSQFTLRDEIASLITKNGFAVDAGTNGGDNEFHEKYEHNRYLKTPNFVTVDSMMHVYHLYFSYLMKNTERNYLSDALLETSKSMLAASEAQLDQLAGTEWESAAQRNTAFFGVGVALLEGSAQVPTSVSQTVQQEAENIISANGIAQSPLTGSDEDYSQYIVRGYYEGDPQLEAYFRAMMWYGRMNFAQKDEDLDRSALLMTLALNDSALDNWSSIYAVTSFFAGASDDCGYYEYYPVIQAAYGDDVSVSSLAGNSSAWENYRILISQMPAPKINSIVVKDEGQGADHLEEEKGFRFMGQRFSVDATILQNLMYSVVGENSSGKARMLPNALDVPAALGSDEALAILDEKGETSYRGYPEKMTELRRAIADAPAETWKASLYSQWLYTLNPLLTAKGDGWPSYMRTSAWARKNLQTYLGSYTELKHDTVLYTKQAMAEFGGGAMDEVDDRGYVEAEPELFGRLAALVQATSSGLEGFSMIGPEDRENLARLQDLALQLQTIANKELKNESPTDGEYELIRSFGGQLEHFWEEVYKNEPDEGGYHTTRQFPAAVVTDIATDPNGSVLELGTGRISTIYVVVPIDGQLRIATGPVYSFYQFEWPLSDRLTDTSWRQMMGIGLQDDGTLAQPAKSVEDWTSTFQYEWRS